MQDLKCSPPLLPTLSLHVVMEKKAIVEKWRKNLDHLQYWTFGTSGFSVFYRGGGGTPSPKDKRENEMSKKCDKRACISHEKIIIYWHNFLPFLPFSSFFFDAMTIHFQLKKNSWYCIFVREGLCRKRDTKINRDGGKYPDILQTTLRCQPNRFTQYTSHTMCSNQRCGSVISRSRTTVTFVFCIHTTTTTNQTGLHSTHHIPCVQNRDVVQWLVGREQLLDCVVNLYTYYHHYQPNWFTQYTSHPMCSNQRCGSVISRLRTTVTFGCKSVYILPPLSTKLVCTVQNTSHVF